MYVGLERSNTVGPCVPIEPILLQRERFCRSEWVPTPVFWQAEGATVSLESSALFDFGLRQLLETIRCAHLCKPIEPILLQHFARFVVLTVSGVRVFAALPMPPKGKPRLSRAKRQRDENAKSVPRGKQTGLGRWRPLAGSRPSPYEKPAATPGLHDEIAFPSLASSSSAARRVPRARLSSEAQPAASTSQRSASMPQPASTPLPSLMPPPSPPVPVSSSTAAQPATIPSSAPPSSTAVAHAAPANRHRRTRSTGPHTAAASDPPPVARSMDHVTELASLSVTVRLWTAAAWDGCSTTNLT